MVSRCHLRSEFLRGPVNSSWTSVLIRLVVEQVLEVPKNSSQDRNLQGTVEQIPENSVFEKTEQLVKVPKTVSRNRVQQRTVEQIVDASVPQAVEIGRSLQGFLPGRDSTAHC